MPFSPGFLRLFFFSFLVFGGQIGCFFVVTLIGMGINAA